MARAGSPSWNLLTDVFALPQLAELAAGAVANAGRVAAGLQVFPDRMRANLAADGGLIMAESVMFRLAPALGREAAHDLVYAAAREARTSGTGLLDALRQLLPPGREALLDDAQAALAPESYVGDPAGVCEAALTMWASASVTVSGGGWPESGPSRGGRPEGGPG
jgi:3-carboxy-cis,cis-muconate cycloisomerase